MTDKHDSTKGPWIIGGIAVFIGVLLVSLFSRLISPTEEEDVDDNAPQKLVMRRDERRYPPFLDQELHSINVEGELDEDGGQQLVAIGIGQKELDASMTSHHSKFALARQDNSGLWHPAVAETALLYGTATDSRSEVYAVAMPVGAGMLHVAPGVMNGAAFTPYKTARILALTNSEGLLYDYPNVPIIQITGKDVS